MPPRALTLEERDTLLGLLFFATHDEAIRTKLTKEIAISVHHELTPQPNRLRPRLPLQQGVRPMIAEDYDPPPWIDDGYDEFQATQRARLESATKPDGFKVWTEEGSEGPRHDPYAYSEIRVELPDGRRIRYRTGMIEELWEGTTAQRWRDLPEVARGGGWGSNDRTLQDQFEAMVGWPCDQLEWWGEEPYRSPCMACGRESGCRGKCQE